MINISNQNIHLLGYYFVTGTDTEIGKTTVTAQLVKQLAEQGQSVYAIKPITAGLSVTTHGVNYSEDAIAINKFSSEKLPLDHIAPFLLKTPCSPHIAAHIDGVTLTAANITTQIQNTLQTYPADSMLIEGAGGWFTPINATETLADVAQCLNFPIIMVVGIKLGCLNHAMLTLQAIQQADLTIAAVVFNAVTPSSDFYNEQVAWLQHAIRQQYAANNERCPVFLQNAYGFTENSPETAGKIAYN